MYAREQENHCMKRHRGHVYVSGRHLFITVAVVVAPFLFFLFFSQAVGIPVAKLFGDVFVSFWRLLIAYIFAAIIGWIFAVLFYRGKRAIIALPLFDVLQSFPTFAMLPLAMYVWGPSNRTIIILLILTIIWPVLFSILSSLKLIKHEWEEAAEMSGLSGMNYIKKFLLPASIPGLITGSIIGLGEGWEALIATEIIVNVKMGLGNFFQTFSHNPTITAFGVLGFLILIFSINKLLWMPLLDWSHRKTDE